MQQACSYKYKNCMCILLAVALQSMALLHCSAVQQYMFLIHGIEEAPAFVANKAAGFYVFFVNGY